MNTRSLTVVVIVALGSAGCQRGTTSGADALESATLAGDELITTPYGTVELQQNFITDESSQRLFDAMDLERAAQAYIWSTPAVSFYTWKIEQDRNYGTGELGVWAVLESLKEKRGIVTGNLTTPYIFQFYDLRNGALVIDYPAGPTAGAVLDFWQRPIFDMGLTGPDQGRGGRYLVVGPGDDVGRYRDPDTYVYQSVTNNIGLGLRLLDPSPEFAEKVKNSLRMGIYGQATAATRFNEGLDVEWSATAYRGLEYWRVLSRFINEEPIREQDKAWTAMLAPLGIVKGKEFQLDERQRRILTEGAALGELMLRNLQINPRMEEPYWPGTHWYRSVGFTIPQITDDRVELDERGIWFYEAVTTSKGMVNPSVGAGQIYMTTKRDSDGNTFRADRTYRLRIPADVPVEQFWALTLYSENTRRPYDNGGTELRSANLDSRMEGLQYNEDGSVDLYVGAEAPAGMESNFMKTVGEDGWFVYFRLYAPGQAFFDKTFSMPDFEVVR
jgi:hypothetical protein